MKTIRILFLALLSIVMVTNAYAGDPLEKELKKEYKDKIKTYKREGWKLSGSSRTLEVKLLQHYDKLKDENNKVIVGAVPRYHSLNVAKQKSFNNVATDYSSKAGSFVKGRVTSEIQNNDTGADELAEFDNFYAAYERLVSKEVKNVLTESYAITRDNSDGTKEYQVFYLLNEKEATDMRIKAMNRAAEESKIAQAHAEKISEYVKKGFLDK